MSWQLLGAIIDICENPRVVTIVERERESDYREVYPMIRREHFDREKVKKAVKCFSANKGVRLNDLLKCLRCLDFDSGRRDLVKGLRGPIENMSYFERVEIMETFDFTSSVPKFLD
jgi:hypothetical protein